MAAAHLDVRLLNQSRQAIDEVIEGRTEAIISGSLPDHAEYRYRSGEISGLRIALGIMEDLVRKMGER